MDIVPLELWEYKRIPCDEGKEQQPVLTSRLCNKCGETDPAKFQRTQSPKQNADYCKACKNQWTRDSYKRRGGKSEERRQREQAHNLRRNFGITEEEYEEKFREQMGLCAACGNAETRMDIRSGRVSKLAVDHDHESGLVRGLLCSNCNVALGLLRDSPLRVKQLLKYVNKYCI